MSDLITIAIAACAFGYAFSTAIKVRRLQEQLDGRPADITNIRDLNFPLGKPLPMLPSQRAETPLGVILTRALEVELKSDRMIANQGAMPLSPEYIPYDLDEQVDDPLAVIARRIGQPQWP